MNLMLYKVSETKLRIFVCQKYILVCIKTFLKTPNLFACKYMYICTRKRYAQKASKPSNFRISVSQWLTFWTVLHIGNFKMSYEEFYTVKSDNTSPLGINISRLYEVKVMVLFADMILTDLATNVNIINLVHHIMTY